MPKCRNCGANNTYFILINYTRVEVCPFCDSQFDPSTGYEYDIMMLFNRLNTSTDYDFLCNEFRKMIGSHSTDFRVWWGQVLCLSKNFSFTNFYREDIINCAKRAIDLAEGTQKTDIQTQWQNYSQIVDRKIKAEQERTAREKQKRLYEQYLAEEEKKRIAAEEKRSLLIRRAICSVIVVVYNILAVRFLFPAIISEIYNSPKIIGIALVVIILNVGICVGMSILSKTIAFVWIPPIFSGISVIICIVGMLSHGDFITNVFVVIVFIVIGFGITAGITAIMAYVVNAYFKKK